MRNERPQTPLSSDPRIHGGGFIKDWEEGVKDEHDAETHWWGMQRKFEDLGIVIPTDAKILEIGSGSNVFLRYLQTLGLDATGVDARPRGEKTESVVQARIEQLPFPMKLSVLLYRVQFLIREYIIKTSRQW